jgi:hypothetical protein
MTPREAARNAACATIAAHRALAESVLLDCYEDVDIGADGEVCADDYDFGHDDLVEFARTVETCALPTH